MLHLSYGRTKSGAAILSSLRFRVAFFLVAAMPKGPAPDLPAISYGTNLAVDLAKVAVYCPATHGLGIPTHTVAERFS